MGRGVTYKLDRRDFGRTLRVYREYSKRDLATIVNTKGFYIARRATVETPKANKGKMLRALMKFVETGSKVIGQRVRFLKSGVKAGKDILLKYKAPLAALIVNARLGKHGGAGLYGAKMLEAVQTLLAARARSIAFLKAGWIGSIKILEPLAEKIGGRTPRQDRTAAEFGQAKGTAQPAREGAWVVKAVFENSAGAAHSQYKDALIEFGAPALQRAFDAEAASMKEYIERKQREAAKRAGIKTN